jgi:carbon storage regulator CsrA
MLVLTRKPGEQIILGEGVNRVVITLVSIEHRGRARIGIEPRDVKVLRGELERSKQDATNNEENLPSIP